MKPEDALAVAHYHREGIPTGALAELGDGVLSKIYKTLAEGEHGFVLVAVDPDDQVIGFVSGVVNLGAFYRLALSQHLIGFALVGLRHALSPRMIRRVINTLLYPSKVAEQYPAAELLSIVIDSAARGTSVGVDLLAELVKEFRRRGVRQFKVMVRADFERANAYYRKHGFKLAGDVDRHGHPSNIYVYETGLE